MHRYFFTTKEDTFINSGSNELTGEDFKDKNVGQDEVLELKKVFLIELFTIQLVFLFSLIPTEIENYISSSVLPHDYKVNLRLYETEGTSGLTEEYKVAAYPLSQEWDEGVGKE